MYIKLALIISLSIGFAKADDMDDCLVQIGDFNDHLKTTKAIDYHIELFNRAVCGQMQDQMENCR